MFAYRVWTVARIVSAGELMLIGARDNSRMLFVPYNELNPLSETAEMLV